MGVMRDRGIDARFLAGLPWLTALFWAVGFGCARARGPALPDGFVRGIGGNWSAGVLL